MIPKFSNLILQSHKLNNIKSCVIPRGLHYLNIKEVMAECKDNVMEEMVANKITIAWEPVKLPASKQVVGGCWVYHMKYLPKGMINRLKAKLAANLLNIWSRQLYKLSSNC